MAKQDLDDADIDILFQKMRREAVAQGVRTDALADPGPLGRFLNGAMELPGRDRLRPALPGKEPAMGQHHAAPLALAPLQTQQVQKMRGEHGVAILAALALLDADQHARTVDIVNLEMRDLRDPQAHAIGHA